MTPSVRLRCWWRWCCSCRSWGAVWRSRRRGRRLGASLAVVLGVVAGLWFAEGWLDAIGNGSLAVFFVGDDGRGGGAGHPDRVRLRHGDAVLHGVCGHDAAADDAGADECRAVGYGAIGNSALRAAGPDDGDRWSRAGTGGVPDHAGWAYAGWAELCAAGGHVSRLRDLGVESGRYGGDRAGAVSGDAASGGQAGRGWWRCWRPPG